MEAGWTMTKSILASVVMLAVVMLMPVALTAAELEEDGGIWIDVRSPAEFREGHIEGAINIPHTEISHRISDFVTDLYQPVHLYGSTGVFAGLALELLMEMGFQYVINEGSYQGLLEREDP